ncbi:MAG TPA: AmpG family muropeptide MFS transporter [Longimicrobium sp.]
MAERRAAGIGQVFASRKMASILLLGFASGLPLYLTSKDLQAWMKLEQVDLATIGYISLLSWPYTFKFLWSPLIDALPIPILGRRRGWLLATQIGLLLAIGWMATHEPRAGLQLVAINAIIIAFFSATQDIAFDAYKIDVLREEELGAGAAIGVLGYRVGMLVVGGLGFILADQIGWRAVYALMAALMIPGIVGTLMAPEPERVMRAPGLGQAIVQPFVDFWRRAGVYAAPILAFIVLYKLGDAVLNNMATPFLLEAGFTQTQIGEVQGVIGLAATIVGVIAGGAVQARIGLVRSLWILGVLQSAVNVSYYVLALNPGNHALMIGAVVLENFFQGTGTAALVAYMMSLANPRFSATQYALLSSFMAFGRDWLGAPAGRLAEHMGWPQFFLITLLLAVPGILLLPLIAPWNAEHPRAAIAAQVEEPIGGRGETEDLGAGGRP